MRGDRTSCGARLPTPPVWWSRDFVLSLGVFEFGGGSHFRRDEAGGCELGEIRSGCYASPFGTDRGWQGRQKDRPAQSEINRRPHELAGGIVFGYSSDADR